MTRICKICINLWATKHNKQTQISKNQLRKLNVVEYTYVLITEGSWGSIASSCKVLVAR